MKLLAATSRTFLLPIAQAPPVLKDAVGSAYLCMRAIDEVEDDPALAPAIKIRLLRGVADALEAGTVGRPLTALDALLASAPADLPDVTRSMAELAVIADPEVQPLIWRYTADMARAMSGWVERQWRIENEADLDQYTFDVAGRVGLLLSGLWEWFDGTVCDDTLAVGFGRALQAVNIVRNSSEDRERGVDFYPPGWDRRDMIAYARRQMALADAYMEPLAPGAVRDFCRIPLELARATLEAIESGREKLSRKEVMGLMATLTRSKGE